MPKTKGFEWKTRYSKTDEPDKHGRWARLCYYNGLLIAFVSRMEYNGNDVYQTTDYFPSKSDGNPCLFFTYKNDNFERMKTLVEQRFLDFLEKVK